MDNKNTNTNSQTQFEKKRKRTRSEAGKNCDNGICGYDHGGAYTYRNIHESYKR